MPNSQQPYTDTPQAHPGFFLGGLHYLFWIFFHPSAWKAYILRATNGVFGADVNFLDLIRAKQHSVTIWRTIAQLAFWCTLLSPLCIAIFLLGTGASIGLATSIGVYLFVGSVVFLFLSGLGINIATACVGALIGIAGYGLVANLGLRGDMGGALALSLAGSIALTLIGQRKTYSSTRQTTGLIIGLALGLASVQLIKFSGQRVEFYEVMTNLMITAGLENVYRGFQLGFTYAVTLVVPYLITLLIAGSRVGVIVGVFAASIWQIAFARLAPDALSFPLIAVSLSSIILGLTFHFWRPVALYPLLAAGNLALFRLDQRRTPDQAPLLRYHPAFWDEHQRLRWIGLDEHLVLIIERNPAEGRQALEYLANSRHQRWAAQSAQIELDARTLERCTTASAIGAAHRTLAAGALEGPASALLRSFSRVSQDVESALRQESTYNRRLALSAVADQLDGLLRELTRSSERYALRFRPVATSWRQVIADHGHALAAESELRQEIDSPYIIGVPLTAQQEIFVGRSDISGRIEQLLLDRRRPPLLLYGQRRMGKTSLLNNLGRLLPSTIVPLFVDLQGPVSRSSDHAGMLYYMARSMAESASQHRQIKLPAITRERLDRDAFGVFDEWLSAVEEALGDSFGLLMLDEFEALDQAISRGRFDEESVLGMLRHMIQHRPRFKILLAGSHTLDEFRRWSSYLINAQVVQIGYLRDSEAHQLIERPVADFALRYEPAATERILTLTRGHPFLVQLLCAELVARKNAQDPAIRRLATLADIDATVPEALASGDMFFADIANNQVSPHGAAILRRLAAQGEGAAMRKEALIDPSDTEAATALRQLLQRDLIEAVEGTYRFQVELIRRWFAQEPGP